MSHADHSMTHSRSDTALSVPDLYHIRHLMRNDCKTITQHGVTQKQKLAAGRKQAKQEVSVRSSKNYTSDNCEGRNDGKTIKAYQTWICISSAPAVHWISENKNCQEPALKRD